MNKKETTTVDTTTTEVEVNLDELLGAPGIENIIVPEGTVDEPEKKPTVLSNTNEDLSYLDPNALDDADADVDIDKKDITDADTSDDDAAEPNLDDILDTDTDSDDSDDDTTVSSTVLKKMIEEGKLKGFVTEDAEGNEIDLPFDDYTAEDWEGVINANINAKVDEVKQSTPREFFEALPQEMQAAAQYIANGGKDLKGLFKHLGHIEETRSLDPSTEQGQEAIVKNYLLGTNFGTEEEIQEIVTEWKDLGTLGNKAEKFKPKLDKIEEDVLNRKLAMQEESRKKQEIAAEAYREDIFNTLSKEDLNGLKLDKKTQSLLFSGLTQANYTSTNGSQTNLLGHLLEKHQWVEPNHSLIAEATWLLSDPEGYKAKLKEMGSNNTNKKIAKQLKTTQQSSNASTKAPSLKGRESKKKMEPSKSFFKRRD